MVTAEQLVNRMNTNQRSVVQIKSGGSTSGAAAHQRRGSAQRWQILSRGTEAISRWSVRCYVCV